MNPTSSEPDFADPHTQEAAATRADLIILRESRIVAHFRCNSPEHRLRIALAELNKHPRLLKMNSSTTGELPELEGPDIWRWVAIQDLCLPIDPRIKTDPDLMFHRLSKLCGNWGIQLIASQPQLVDPGWTLFGRWHDDTLVIDHAVRGNHFDEMPLELVAIEQEADQPWCNHVPVASLRDALDVALAQHNAYERS